MKQFHRVTVRDHDSRMGDCSVCGEGVALRRRARRGTVEWSCMWKHRQYRGSKVVPAHRKHVGTSCETCGFVAVHRAQLDVHHVNGNHGDNRPENLQTLCANCHRLVHAPLSSDEVAA